jgi:alpha-mannosidase
LFVFAIDAAPTTKTLTLPNNDKIRIVAIPIAEGGPQVHPAQLLTDELEN